MPGDLCTTRSALPLPLDIIERKRKKKRTTDSPESIEEREIFLLQSNKFELLYQDKISWLVTMCVHRAHFHSTTAVLVFLVVFFAPWW